MEKEKIQTLTSEQLQLIGMIEDILEELDFGEAQEVLKIVEKRLAED